MDYLQLFEQHGLAGLVIASQFGLIFWMIRSQRNGFIKILTEVIEVLTSVKTLIKERLPK